MSGEGDKVMGYYAPKGLYGIQAWQGLHVYYPGMKCYFGPIKDNKWVWMTPTDQDYNPLKDMSKYELKETGYWFVWDGWVKEKAAEMGIEGGVEELHLVPVMYTLAGYNPYYGGSITWDKLVKYVGNDAIALTNYATKVDVGEPKITTYAADQVWGRDLKNGKRSMGFFSTLEVENGGRLKDWGVKIYLYDHQKKIIKTPNGASYRVVKMDNANRSGRYTFVCSFTTDWNEYLPYYDEKGNLIENVRKNMNLYFRIVPYWNNPYVTGKMQYISADDWDSKHKHPLQYEYEDPLTEQALANDTEKYGSGKSCDLDKTP